MENRETVRTLRTMATGQVRELIAAVVESLPMDMPADVAQGWIGNKRGLAKVLRDALVPPVVYTPHIIDCDAAPYVPDGWKVEEHTPGGQFEWNPHSIELHLSDQQKGGLVEGYKLRKELASVPVLNARVLDYLLDHPNLIPEEWKGKYVFFWGTIYRDSDGNFYIRCLYWDGKSWSWSGGWPVHEWGANDPAAVRKVS